MQGLGQLRSELSVQRAVQKYVPRVLRGVIVAFPNRDASETESVQICLKSTETSEKLRGDVGRRKPYHCDYTMNIRCWGMLRAYMAVVISGPQTKPLTRYLQCLSGKYKLPDTWDLLHQTLWVSG